MAQTSEYRLAVIADTPVFYAPLDEAAAPEERKTGAILEEVNTPTGATAFDSGWSFNGTDECLLGPATDFDQVAGYIGVNGEFSLELWMKQNNGWSGDNNRVLVRWGGYGIFIRMYGFPAQTDAYMIGGFYSPDAAERNAEEYGTWMDNNWHHIVVTFARPTLKLYIDGNLVQTETRDFDVQITDTESDFIGIGRDGPFTQNHFPGTIDDVAIYNYELTEAQIDAHFVADRTEITDDEPEIGDPPGGSPRQPPEGIASSFHCAWDTVTEFAKEVHVDFTCMVEPTVDDLYFWALQCSFYDASDNELGGAHTGLQWNSSHPENNAVNWGGYDNLSVELPGSVSQFPSTPDNDNTRDYLWNVGQTYHLRIWVSDPGEISASIDGELIRTLICDDTVKLGSYTMWSEIFAQCSDPSVTVKWENMRIINMSDDEVLETEFFINYQAEENDGCLNTNTYEYNESIRQQTNTTRITPQDAILVLQAVEATGGQFGVGFIPIA